MKKKKKKKKKKSQFILLKIPSHLVRLLGKIQALSIEVLYVFSYFSFGFEGRIWDLTVSVPDHCLSFYFSH